MQGTSASWYAAPVLKELKIHFGHGMLPIALLFLSACGSTQYYGGLGAFSPEINRVSTDATAATGKIAPLTYPALLQARGKSRLGTLSLNAFATPLPRQSPEGGTKIFTSSLGLIWQPSFLSTRFFEIGLGPSLLVTSQMGSGKTITLNNGTTTMTFYTPGSTRSTFLINPTASIDFPIGGKLLLGGEIQCLECVSKYKRTYAGLASLRMKLGGSTR